MAKDYYDILGVQPDDELEVIKRQYRVLVRENHPDVARDKDTAHARMQVILEAWGVLSDPDERARYDRSRQAASPPVIKPGTVRSDGWPTTRPPDTVRKARAAQNFKNSRPSHHINNPRTRLLTMVFEAAQLYHEGKMGEAVAICTKVMKTDPTHAEAPALLGDIYSEQGRNDVALLMYERAMRNQPNNLLYRQKWQAIKNGEVISPPVSQVRVEPSPAPPPSAPSSPATPPITPSSHAGTNGHATAQAVNGAASSSSGSNGAAPTQSATEGINKSKPVEESPVNSEPTGAEPSRGSLVGKLAGWMGKRK